MSADIFVSFASPDSKIAQTICTALETRGFKCWIASRDIMPGENFQSAIVRAIRSAKVLLLVFSSNSNRSDEMTKELALASQQKLIVVPLRVENVTPSDAFAYEFATRQWIDLFANWEDAMNHLRTRLTAALVDDRTHVDTIVLAHPAVDPLAVAALAALHQRRTRFAGVAVCAVVLAVAAIIAVPRLFSKPSVQAVAGDAVPAAPAKPAPPPVQTSVIGTTSAATSAPLVGLAASTPSAAPVLPAPEAPATPAVPKPRHHSSHKASSSLPY
jgi:hypothetical protein